jgi:hypothetical protein
MEFVKDLYGHTKKERPLGTKKECRSAKGTNEQASSKQPPTPCKP